MDRNLRSSTTAELLAEVTEMAPPKPASRRFHGAVTLDAARAGLDASKVAGAVVAHLAGQVGARVTVTLEIHAELPDGASEHLVRTGRTLKFDSQGFEKE